MPDITSENLSFTVDARLIRELGEKLVTRDYLALAELIKNAYDADSDKVEITFKNVTENNSDAEIIIKDFGTGMNWNEVNNYWMRISTANKEDNPVSQKYGRKKSGSKGIGRLACQKLAHTVTIDTISQVTSSTAQVISFTVEWDDFIDGKDLIEVTCRSKRYETNLSDVTLGTTIYLKNLKRSWTQGSYNSLQRQLSSLSIAQPVRRGNPYKEDPGFEILINANEFENDNYKLSEKVLDASWGRLTGEVLEDGTVNIEFDGKLIGKKTYLLPEKYPLLKSAKFDITYFSDLRKYRRNPSLVTQEQMKIIQETYTGVKVYSEGFRVYPYGEEGDDWLGLDQEVGRRRASVKDDSLKEIATAYSLDPSRVLLDMFRNKSLVGATYIDTNQNPNFSIKLNREGFISNAASDSLKKLLKYVIEWMTIQYSYFKLIHANYELEIAETEFSKHFEQSPDSFLKSENIKSATEKQLRQQFDKALKVLKTNKGNEFTTSKEGGSLELINAATNYIQKQFDSNKNELTLLRAIASTGPLFFVFAHEFRGLISHLDTNAGRIEQFANEHNNTNERKALKEIATSLRSARERFLSLENLIGIFASTHKTELRKINILDAIKKVCDGFEFITSENRIQIEYNSINERLKTPKMTEAAFYSILVNIITNAIKAVLAKGKRQIRITASREAKLTIRIEDRGIGLEQDRWEDAFLPLVTDPSGTLYKELDSKTSTDELAVLGKGTGLGLNIVKRMVNDYSGTVNFTTPTEGWSTCLEIKLD